MKPSCVGIGMRPTPRRRTLPVYSYSTRSWKLTAGESLEHGDVDRLPEAARLSQVERHQRGGESEESGDVVSRRTRPA